MDIGLLSFRFDSNYPRVTQHYIAWLVEALQKYEDREGGLPELVLCAGFTCMDPNGLSILQRELGHKRISLGIEMLDPGDDPLVGPTGLKGSGQFYVLGNGKCLMLGPRQQFSSTSNVDEVRAGNVVTGLAVSGGRRFSTRSLQIGWLECGEINLLRCQQDGSVAVRYPNLEKPFFDTMTSLDIILNPQHTRMSRLHLLRRKVDALSEGAIVNAPSGRHWPVYVGTANWNEARQRKSQGNLQSIMCNGDNLTPRITGETEDYIFAIYSVEVSHRPY